MVGNVQTTRLLSIPTTYARLAPLLIIGLVLSAHSAVNQIPTLVSPLTNMYVIQPVLWVMPALLVFLLTRGRWTWCSDRSVLIPAILNSLALVFVQYAAGVYTDLGWSPYNHEPLSLALNAWYLSSILISREVIRVYLLRAIAPVGEGVAIGATWLVLSVTAIPFASFTMLQYPSSAFPLLGKLVLPTLAIQFLATLLAHRGGPVASITYLGALLAAEWFLPILPDLQWMMAAFIGVIVPVVGATAMQKSSAATDDGNTGELIGPSPSVLAVSGFVVAFMWFSTGITGFQPTVVYGHSMDPTYATGDIVVTQKLDPDELAVGDIVVFRNSSLQVVHRIISIESTGEGLVFTTQGDNNDAPDEAFLEDDLLGKVQLHVPKVALPGIWFRKLTTWAIRVGFPRRS